MRRLLRVRLLFVLIALLILPTPALPFAERLRTEWARNWEPKPKAVTEIERLLAEADARLEALGFAGYPHTPFPDSPPLGYPDAARSAEILAEDAAMKRRSAARADR